MAKITKMKRYNNLDSMIEDMENALNNVGVESSKDVCTSDEECFYSNDEDDEDIEESDDLIFL